ncbi:hypothetical protein V3C99_016550 [Haemonchus contortus]|uniref:ShKT domain-containing protein n=1 Tax=Haemonchus contortus TaxID=6289 RepID=A0A7I4YYM4_HAECO
MRVLLFILCLLMIIVPTTQISKDSFKACKYLKKLCYSKNKNELTFMKMHCKKTCGFR